MEHEDLPTARVATRRFGKALAWVITLAVITAVVSFYAFQLWIEDQHKYTKLVSVGKQMAALTRAHKEQGKKLEQLQHTGAEEHERLVQDDAELLATKERLAAAEARLGELENEHKALSEQVEEFDRMKQQFQRMIDSGKLSVNFRRGRMIVELPDAVLFASGSAELSSDGQAALKEVAKILRQVPGKRFLVGGHTDDVPIAKPEAGFSSNWALSAARAVTVTEALIASGVKASRLVAAGYGPFDPIAANTSARGRQKNRRIEIVLEPDLRELKSTLKVAQTKG